MNRTEERLTDALGAAARAVPADTLRPLAVPARRRHRPGWVAPVAAAASLLLVVGIGVAVAGQLPGTGSTAGSSAGAIAPHRYYVEAGLEGSVVVRSTATGAVTATVLDPEPNYSGEAVVASAGNGTFFVAGDRHQTGQERIYHFRLTGSGKVTGFSPVPGGVLRAGQLADALAVSPDGSQLAVGVSFYIVHPKSNKLYPPGPSDQIFVINTATGARSMWRGGMHALGSGFGVASLSWTGDGHELVVLGQWCSYKSDSDETCLAKNARRNAEVWALDPASRGGRLASGHLLLRQSARYPYIAQAFISPDGSTITAIVLTGPVAGSKAARGQVPGNMSVPQISVATGRQLGVLYSRRLGSTWAVNSSPDFLALIPDGAGQHWMIDGGIASHGYDGFNGWIDNGHLVPLSPRNGRAATETW
jgi:hypothetical protein